MPIVTPTLNLPLSATTTKSAAPVAPAPAPLAMPAPVATPSAPAAPSATVTLSPQALSLAAGSHPATPSTTGAAPAVAVAHDGSVYESLKSGISNAVTDVEDAIASGAHAVVDGVEHALSTTNDIAKGILELPFAAVSKGCDAVGSLIDEL
jgi:hypothetical protein